MICLLLTEGIMSMNKISLWSSFIRATEDERRCPLPADDRIPDAIDSITHAITIDAPPHEVWPWLVQMGAGNRAGWYSYDWIDNGRRPSADRIIGALQDPPVGTVFPALPGMTDGFVLDAIARDRHLVLLAPGPDGKPIVTWTFVLNPVGATRTRLLVRVRGAKGYRFLGLPSFLTKPAVHVVHFIMERRQLRGIVDRVDRLAEVDVA